MSSISAEDKYWKGQVEGLHHDALKNVRDTATKWQAAIVAVLGGFVTVGFVWGPDKLEKYPIGHGFWRDLSLALLLIAGAFGVAAAILMSLAGIGLPRNYRFMTGPDLEHWTQKQAANVIKRMHQGMVCAAIAAILAVAVTGWVLVAAATKAPDPKKVQAIVSVNGVQVCGELTGSKALQVRVGSNDIRLPARSRVQIVADCPG